MENIKPKPWRRFFARLVDYSLYTFIATLLMFCLAFISSHEIWIFILAIFSLSVWRFGLWIFVEAAFIARWGTTLGKWLFNTQVLTQEGAKLSYKQARKRAIKVFSEGQFLFLPIFTIVAHFLSFRKLTQEGIISWDKAENHIISHGEIGPLRSTLASILVILSIIYLWTFAPIMFMEYRMIWQWVR